MSSQVAYDYIVVGSGTAGALVANRLSANPNNKVLVVEAGDKDRHFWLKLPVGFFKTFMNPTFANIYNTTPQDISGKRHIDIPRGRVWGGSSSINGMLFIRGHPQDFDDWQKMGAMGWDYQSVLPYFRAFECYQGDASQYRGQMGELSVQHQRYIHPTFAPWIAGVKTLGYPENPDFNGDTTYGVGRYQATIQGHWRASSATAFLKPALHRPNVDIFVKTLVTKVITESKKAIGVQIYQNKQFKNIYARKHIILCGGAVQSPQILELSGIGQRHRLQSLGIPVVQDSPHVGENLQDHYSISSVVRLKHKHSLNDAVHNPFSLLKMGYDWMIHKSGPLACGISQVGGAVCSKYAENNRPDLQVYILPLSLDKDGTFESYSGFTTSVWQCHPKSRGSVHINDTSPFTKPVITANFLQDKLDCKVMVEGIKMIRKIYHTANFKNLWDKEISPGTACQTDAELLQYIRENGTTSHHVCGTCRMGDDKNAVVDCRLRVKGVQNLRVIDASVMPQITSANTNAPTYMIAEKGAYMVLQDNIK